MQNRPADDGQSPEKFEGEQSFEEFNEYLEGDLAYERARFDEVVQHFELESALSSAELEQLLELWGSANENNFLMNVPGNSLGPMRKVHEGATRRSELHFMKLVQEFRATAGWRNLPEATRAEIERRLFRVSVDDEHLRS